MAVDQNKVEEFSNTLTSNGINNWIVGIIDKVKPELVRVSENVEYIKITKI